MNTQKKVRKCTMASLDKKNVDRPGYHKIDLEQWERREHYRYYTKQLKIEFSLTAFPVCRGSVLPDTAAVQLTENLSFFLFLRRENISGRGMRSGCR